MAVATEPRTAEHVRDTDEFPYHFEIVSLDQMFVDGDYQRPLTTFWRTVRDQFDPALVGCLVVNRRSDRRLKTPYALVDGQTRRAAMLERERTQAPCIVYEGLTPKEEASLFARLQSQRRGMASYIRFRAALASGDEESREIEQLVKETGYTVGLKAGGGGPISAVAALEKCYRKDPYTLERTLVTLRAAWPKFTPSGWIIQGVFEFYSTRDRRDEDTDDERLSRRLSISTEGDLLKRAHAFREGTGHGSASLHRFVAMAVEAIYSKR